MRKLLIGLFILMATSTSAMAQEIGGTYAMSGQLPDGSPYSGTTEITPRGQTYLVSQDGGALTGVGLLVGDQFSVALNESSSTYVAVYELLDDGSLQGIWAVEGEGQVGTELLTPQGGAGGGGGSGGGK